jgi:hypothetical protein
MGQERHGKARGERRSHQAFSAEHAARHVDREASSAQRGEGELAEQNGAREAHVGDIIRFGGTHDGARAIRAAEPCSR